VEVDEREEVVDRESWAGVEPRLGFLVVGCSPI
jgi:phage terminase large subunit-like protein